MGTHRKGGLPDLAEMQEHDRMRITLLGEPGSGKTTLGRRVEAEGLAVYLSGSRLLQTYIDARGAGWQELQAAKDGGNRADPAFTHRLLREALEGLPAGTSVVLDGFPKGLAELTRTENALGAPIDLAILLDCPTAIRSARIEHRVACPGCGAVATIAAASSAAHGPGCAATFMPRVDDHPQVVARREAQESIELLATRFETDGRLWRVRAERSAEAVFQDVSATLRQMTQRAG
ncbi:MAG TPA: nucleoside monophosphate kinase [Baekduia sp.]